MRGLLSAPTRFQVFHTAPPNAIIARFPFIWLPCVLVAVALLLHVLSLRQMRLLARTPGREPASAVPDAARG